MSQDIASADIILLALVAGFLILRLRSVLGQKNGTERDRDLHGRPSETHDNVVFLPENSPASTGESATGVDDLPDDVRDQLHDLEKVDPTFAPQDFLTGARRAFEMVVSAFAAGDRDTLKFLLAGTLYTSFEAEIQSREEQNQTLETGIELVRSLTFQKIHRHEGIAFVTVRILSEQITVTRDSEGRIVDGDPNELVERTDDWTFSRRVDADRRIGCWLPRMLRPSKGRSFSSSGGIIGEIDGGTGGSLRPLWAGLPWSCPKSWISRCQTSRYWGTFVGGMAALLLVSCAKERSPGPPPVIPYTQAIVPVPFSALPGWADDTVVEALPALHQSCLSFRRRPSHHWVGPGVLGGTVGTWRTLCDTLDAAFPKGDLADSPLILSPSGPFWKKPFSRGPCRNAQKTVVSKRGGPSPAIMKPNLKAAVRKPRPVRFPCTAPARGHHRGQRRAASPFARRY